MSEIYRDPYFHERLAEEREECSRRFYVRQDEIDIGPFPNNGIAWEWAERTGTIAYEVVCGVSARVPRSYRS